MVINIRWQFEENTPEKMQASQKYVIKLYTHYNQTHITHLE